MFKNFPVVELPVIDLSGYRNLADNIGVFVGLPLIGLVLLWFISVETYESVINYRQVNKNIKRLLELEDDYNELSDEEYDELDSLNKLTPRQRKILEYIRRKREAPSVARVLWWRIAEWLNPIREIFRGQQGCDGTSGPPGPCGASGPMGLPADYMFKVWLETHPGQNVDQFLDWFRDCLTGERSSKDVEASPGINKSSLFSTMTSGDEPFRRTSQPHGTYRSSDDQSDDNLAHAGLPKPKD